MNFSALVKSIVGRVRNPASHQSSASTFGDNTEHSVGMDGTDAPAQAPGVATRSRRVNPQPATGEDEYFERLRNDEIAATSRLDTDLEAYRTIQQEKDALKNKPIEKVPAWKRMLAGALQNIGRQNPNASWGEILGSGIGGGAVSAASPRIYEQNERIRRNAQIDAEYADRETSAGKNFELDARVAELARRRTDIASRDADRRMRAENQAQANEDRRVYQEGMLETRRAQNEETARRNKAQEDLSRQREANRQAFNEATIKWREEGRKIQWDTLKETKAMHEFQRAQARGVTSTYYPVEVTVNGETRIQRVPVPDDVTDVKAYLEEIYSPTSAIGKGVGKTIQPGVPAKNSRRGASKSGKQSIENISRRNQANSSETYSKGFIGGNR